MPKRYIIVILGILGAVVLYLVVTANTKPDSDTPPMATSTPSRGSGRPIPDYILEENEERQLKEFVKNFITLYNTYSNTDFTNLTSLGDYETPELQQQTLDFVEQLKEKTPEGFDRSTKADESTFSYKYPSASSLTIDMQGTVTETASAQSAPQTYTVKASLGFQKVQGRWLVNSIEINKQ